MPLGWNMDASLGGGVLLSVQLAEKHQWLILKSLLCLPVYFLFRGSIFLPSRSSPPDYDFPNPLASSHYNPSLKASVTGLKMCVGWGVALLESVHKLAHFIVQFLGKFQGP